MSTSAPTELADEVPDKYDLTVFPHNFPIIDTSTMVHLVSDTCRLKQSSGDKYRIGTKFYYYKPFESINYECMLATIEKFQKINELGDPKKLRMCKLFGVVNGGYSSDGYTYLPRGLVYHWVNLKDGWKSIADVLTLGNVSMEDRNKWMIQIQQTVAELHRIGVVWGDARADCVMIDQYNKAVILDLEGGYTQGWVDKDLEGTLEGDMQALTKLMEFIYDDKCPRRLQVLQQAIEGRRDWGAVTNRELSMMSQYLQRHAK